MNAMRHPLKGMWTYERDPKWAGPARDAAREHAVLLGLAGAPLLDFACGLGEAVANAFGRTVAATWVCVRVWEEGEPAERRGVWWAVVDNGTCPVDPWRELVRERAAAARLAEGLTDAPEQGRGFLLIDSTCARWEYESRQGRTEIRGMVRR